MKKLFTFLIILLGVTGTYAQGIHIYDRTTYVEIRNHGQYINLTKGGGYKVQAWSQNSSWIEISKGEDDGRPQLLFRFAQADCDTPASTTVNSLISQLASLLSGSAGGGSSSVTVTSSVLPSNASTDSALHNGHQETLIIGPSGKSAAVNSSGQLKTDGSSVTQPISASTLPLPSGAATSANQSTEISSLSSIATNTTGAATAANQTTANTSLASIATNTANIPARGQAIMANSSPVAIASDQSSLPVYNSVLAQNGSVTSATDIIASTDASRYKSFSLQMTSIGSGNTIQVQGSNDNTTWIQMSAWKQDNSVPPVMTATINFNVTGIYSNAINYRYIKVTVTAYGSGTVAAYLVLSTAPFNYVNSYTNVNNSPLPVSQNGPWTVQPGNTANTTAWKVDGSAVVQPASQSGPWTVQPGNTPNTVPWNTSVQAGTTSGDLDFHFLPGTGTNGTVIKSSAGQIYGYDIYNASGSLRYVKVFNRSSPPAVGTDFPVRTIAVPAGTRISYYAVQGIFLSIGISIATTAGMPDMDSAPITAGDLLIEIDYK